MEKEDRSFKPKSVRSAEEVDGGIEDRACG